MTNDFIIRVSSLPTARDCMRRWMVDLRPAWIESLGYELNQRPVGIGAHCGCGTHIAVAHSWEGFGVNGMRWAHFDDCVQHGFEEYKERVETEGCEYDDTTPNDNAAQRAILKMTRAYRDHCKPTWIPELIERRLEAQIRPGYILRGHTDLVRSESGVTYDTGAPLYTLNDLKTGVQIAAPGAQVGGYDLLCSAMPDVEEVQKATMTYVRRTRMKTEQTPPYEFTFDREATRAEATAVIFDIVDRVEEFRSPDSRPWTTVFPANTSSKLCGDKYCRAFRTRWCPESFNKPVLKEKDLV